jgi:CBS domain-containing protein
MATRRLKRLPVVDERGRLAGIVSRVDLLRAAAGLARPGEEPPRPGFGGETTVGQVMRKDIPAVLPDMPLPDVLQAVISTRLNKALVVDGERRVLGLVTDEELIDRMTRSLRPGLLRSLMLRVPFAHVAPKDQLAAQHARARRAADLMVTGVPTVTLDTPIGAATAAMLEADRKILAVTDADGRLAGIVDRADLLRGLATPPGPEPGALRSP